MRGHRGHVGELKQLFNVIDPSPFRKKYLEADAEEFIAGWQAHQIGARDGSTSRPGAWAASRH
jgi:hypothetical protein